MGSIGDIYGDMLNGVKRNLKESTKPKTFGGEDPTKLVGDGPNVDGYNKAVNDCGCVGPCDCNEEDEEDEDESTEEAKKCQDEARCEVYDEPMKKKKEWVNKQLLDDEEDEEIVKENKKYISPVVNRHMSDSLFDKLLDKVLNENFGQDQEKDDLGALGLDDATPDSELGDDFGGEDDFGSEEDTVTVTLDRALAQQLVDVLKGVLGEGEEEDLGGEDDLDLEGGDDFGSEGDDLSFEEDEEEGTSKKESSGKLHGNSKLQGKNNKVGGPGVQPTGGKASSDVTDKTGTEKGKESYDDGKSNQVKGSKLSKGKDYFKV